MELLPVGNQNKTTEKNNINEKSSNHLPSQIVNIKYNIINNKINQNNIRTDNRNCKDKDNNKENNKINDLSETFINI